MEAADSVDRFLTDAARLLAGQGWSILDEAPASFDMVAARDNTALVVQTRVALVFVTADTLSPADMAEAMQQAHDMTGDAAQTPLFPATAVVVFVFSDVQSNEIPEKKRDVARSHATVAWTANLQTGQLNVHHGAPLVRDGRRELEEALQMLASES